MYSATPPPLGPAALPLRTMGVRRGVRLDFPGPAALAKNPAYADLLREYLADSLRPYGLELNAELLQSGGQSYGEMAETLVQLAVPEGESVEVLVLASAVPDIAPGRSTATYLSYVCPGTPLAFGLSDQGPAAAFTALRLVSEYAKTDGLHRALLLVVEQNWLPYDSRGAALPVANCGVALLLGDDFDGPDRSDADPPMRTARLGCVQVLPGTRAPAKTFTDMLGDVLGADACDAAVILGHGLAPRASALAESARAPERCRFRVARSGQPTTGAWWELLGELTHGRGEDPATNSSDVTASRIVLADYDADSATLCVASFSATGEEGDAPG